MSKTIQDPKFNLSPEGVQIIQKEMKRYETKLSCLIPCLYQIQKEKGWISPQAVAWLSEQTSIAESHIYEVVMFYTLFNKKPMGRFHVQVCCNVSCALNGGRELLKKLCETFQVREGEVSADGNITISRVECLGGCDQAPVVQVNDEDYLNKVKWDKMVEILKENIQSQS